MEESPRTSLRRSGPWLSIFVVLLVAAAGAGGYWWWTHRAPPPAPAPVAAAAPTPPPAPAPEVAPPVDEAKLESMLGSVSPSKLWAKLVASGDLIRRWAVVTVNVAQDESPARELAALKPEKPFAVEKKKHGKLFIAPKSYARYDAAGDMVKSVDAGAVAAVYAAFKPPVEFAVHQLGLQNAKLDDLAKRALDRIALAPVAAGPVALAPKKGYFAFADEKLEKLGPIDKQLLRMGPRNEKLLQAKALELEKALGMPVAEVARAK